MLPSRNPPKVAQRVCLKCGQSFESRGPGNRICQPCTRINQALKVPEPVIAKQRGAKRHNGDLMDVEKQ